MTSETAATHMSAAAVRAVHEALQGVTVIALTGAIKGKAYLTPPSVRRTIIELPFRPSPFAFSEHAEFSVNHAQNAALLAPYNHGIFVTGLRFPDVCCVCGASVSQFEVFEAGLNEGRYLYKTSFGEGLTAEQRQALYAACVDKRFWCAIPFCSTHRGLDGVHIDSDGIEFESRDYAEAFAKLNTLQGRWVGQNTLVVRILLQWIGFGLVVAGMIRGFINWGKYSDWTGIMLACVGGAMLVAGHFVLAGRAEVIPNATSSS